MEKNPKIKDHIFTLILSLFFVSLPFISHCQNIELRSDVFISGTEGYNTYRIPAIIQSNSGVLLAFCEGRKNNSQDSGDIDLLLKRSIDNGRTWGKTQTVYENGGNDSITIGNPSPVVMENTIHLLFTENNRKLFYTKSDNEGLNWEKPKELTSIFDKVKYPWIMVATGPGHGIITSKGRIIIPVWMSDTERENRALNPTMDQLIAGIIYSDDKGISWHVGGFVPATISRLHEHTILEQNDHILLTSIRAHGAGYRATSLSQDGGITWSKPILAKDLPDPTCHASILKVNDSLYALTNIPIMKQGGYHGPSRKNLTLKLSTNRGKNWTSRLLLHDGPSGYSDLVKLSETNIGCLFENGVNDYVEKITFINISIEDMD